jgi:gamma-glutamylcyclotransferase (GGCT)/AIG2-like uncharacterized protein YtfP
MDVFVYGTLTDRDRATAVLGEDGFEFVGQAQLEGLHRIEGRYPTLAPGGRVEGRLLRTDRLGALDRYEGAANGLYIRVSIPGDGERAAVYVGDPDQIEVSEPVVWLGEGTFGERVERYVSDTRTHVLSTNSTICSATSSPASSWRK